MCEVSSSDLYQPFDFIVTLTAVILLLYHFYVCWSAVIIVAFVILLFCISEDVPSC